MESLKPFKVTSSGRPELFEDHDEVVREMQEGTALYEGVKSGKPSHTEGTIYITTHRLLWKRDQVTLGLNLADVKEFSHQKKMMASHKLVVTVSNGGAFRVSFRSGGHSTFLEQCSAALKSEAWKHVPKKKQEETKKEFTTSSAGIVGIARKKADEAAKADETMDEAFADLDSLMKKARDMVAIAEKIAASSDKLEGNDDEAKVASALRDLGVASPITKDLAGQKYHEELARELADFLQPRLAKAPGCQLSLTDVFCIYNRARGTEMVSPEDLQKAAQRLEPLGLSCKLKNYESGLKAITLVDKSEELAAEGIADVVHEQGPQSPYTLALAMSLAIPLAQELLRASEQSGLLCRDESPNGVIYHDNFFANYEAVYA